MGMNQATGITIFTKYLKSVINQYSYVRSLVPECQLSVDWLLKSDELSRNRFEKKFTRWRFVKAYWNACKVRQSGCRRNKKKPRHRVIPGFSIKSLAVTYFHMGKPHTIIGAEQFHFRVRDGIGWFPLAKAARQTGMEKGAGYIYLVT
jgi:hypothetical protein